MARILVTEKIADTGLERLRDAGHEVVIRDGLSADGS
jgi:D-3-phosphoglycerate dehydrogenase